MTFLSVLIALFAERYVVPLLLPHGGSQATRISRWIIPENTSGRVHSVLRHSATPWVLVIVSTLSVFALGLLIENTLLRLLASALILLACLGPRDLAGDIKKLIDAKENDDSATESELLEGVLHGPDRRSSKRNLIGGLFVQGHERLFGVLIWFTLFGAVGAVFYRASSRFSLRYSEVYPDSPALASARSLHALAAWLPSRITIILFGLAGSLDDCLSAWKRFSGYSIPWVDKPWAFLSEVSAASLSVDESENGGEVVPANLSALLLEVMRLQQRSLLILLSGLALASIGGIWL